MFLRMVWRYGGKRRMKKSKGEVRKPFEAVIKSEWIFFESGKISKKFSRDTTGTALKRMAYINMGV